MHHTTLNIDFFPETLLVAFHVIKLRSISVREEHQRAESRGSKFYIESRLWELEMDSAKTVLS